MPRVLGVDIVRHHEAVEYVAIDEGLAAADIIVCAMNLTAENRGYFSYDRLKQTRPGTVFVNISRGEQSPAADLLPGARRPASPRSARWSRPRRRRPP